MEIEESLLSQSAKTVFVTGVATGLASGALAAELAQGADPVIFSPETGKVVAEYMFAASMAGIGVGTALKMFERLIDSVSSRNGI